MKKQSACGKIEAPSAGSSQSLPKTIPVQGLTIKTEKFGAIKIVPYNKTDMGILWTPEGPPHQQSKPRNFFFKKQLARLPKEQCIGKMRPCNIENKHYWCLEFANLSHLEIFIEIHQNLTTILRAPVYLSKVNLEPVVLELEA